MKKIILFFAICLTISLLSFKHPLHVSVTNIEYMADSNEFVVSVKLFKDDFQNVIMLKYNENLNIDSLTPNTNIKYKMYENHINKYISEHFQVDFNNKKNQNIVFDGYTLDHEAIWIYYKFMLPEKAKSIKITNSLMTDLFEDQTNLLIFNFDKIQKAEMLNNKTTIVDIELK